MENKGAVILDNHSESFIEDSVMSGKYSSNEDVIQTALRLLETEDKKNRLICKQLELGEKSAKIAKFNAERHLEKLHEKYL